MHDFEECIGVELLENLHKKSLELKQLYDGAAQGHSFGLSERSPKFTVDQGDLLEYDWWSKADLVLANSTCFEFQLMLKIAEKASLMKKGAWMITLTKKLPCLDPIYNKTNTLGEWECVMSIKMPMSWGFATVNIQRKVL